MRVSTQGVPDLAVTVVSRRFMGPERIATGHGRDRVPQSRVAK
jgi:hypothetical protein